MNNIKFNALETKMINDFSGLAAKTEAASANIATAQTAADVKTEICKIWSEVRPYLIWAKDIPVVGKYISILFEVFDPICGTN